MFTASRMWGVYKRHTPFAMVSERMNIQDNVIRIPKKGDLLSYIYLTRTQKSTGTLVPWDSSIINSWKLYIGQELIDTQDSVFSLTVAPQLLSRTYSRASIQPVSLFCPLQFWFCNDLPLPLVALQYDDITIRMDWTPDPAYYYECHMNFILLGEEEREWFATTAHEISIYQVNKLNSQSDIVLRNPVNFIASAPVKLPNYFTYGITINGKDLRREYNSHGAQLSFHTEYSRVLAATSDPYPPVSMTQDSQVLYANYGIGAYSISLSGNTTSTYAFNLHDGNPSTYWQTAGQQTPSVAVTYNSSGSSNVGNSWFAFDQSLTTNWVSSIGSYSGNDPALSGAYIADSSTHDPTAYYAFDNNGSTTWTSVAAYGVTYPPNGAMNTFSSSNTLTNPEYLAFDGSQTTYWSSNGANLNNTYYMDYLGNYTMNVSSSNTGLNYQAYDGNVATSWESNVQGSYGVTALQGTYNSSGSSNVGNAWTAFDQAGASTSWITAPNYGAVVNVTTVFNISGSSNNNVPGSEYLAFDSKQGTRWTSNISYGYATIPGNYFSNSSYNWGSSWVPFNSLPFLVPTNPAIISGSVNQSTVGGYPVFQSIGGSFTLSLFTTTTLDVLLVGGGGGGSIDHPSGGAGGVVFYPGLILPPGTYAGSVGGGGAGAFIFYPYRSAGRGGNGGNTTFASLIADGGGGAGFYQPNKGSYGEGGNGGCGGGWDFHGSPGITTQGGSDGSTGSPYGFGTSASGIVGGSVGISGALGYSFSTIYGSAYTSVCEPNGTVSVTGGSGVGAGGLNDSGYSPYPELLTSASGGGGLILIRAKISTSAWTSNTVYGNTFTGTYGVTASSNLDSNPGYSVADGNDGQYWISNALSNVYGYAAPSGLYGSNASTNSSSAWLAMNMNNTTNWTSAASSPYGLNLSAGLTYTTSVSTGSPSWGPFYPSSYNFWNPNGGQYYGSGITVSSISTSTSNLSVSHWGFTSNICYNPYINVNGTLASATTYYGEYIDFFFSSTATPTRYGFNLAGNQGGLTYEYGGPTFGPSLPNNFLTTWNDTSGWATYGTTSSMIFNTGQFHAFGWFYPPLTGTYTFNLNVYGGYANLWVNNQTAQLSASQTSWSVSMTKGTGYYLRVLGFSYVSATVVVSGPGFPVGGTTSLGGCVFAGQNNSMYALDAPRNWVVLGDALGNGVFTVLDSTWRVTNYLSNVVQNGSYSFTIASPAAVARLRFVFLNTLASNILSIPSIWVADASGSLQYNGGGKYQGTSTVGGTLGEWIEIDFPSTQQIYEYVFKLDVDPVSWTLYGTNTPGTWTAIDTVTGQFYPYQSTEIHRLVSANYQYYRLQIRETNAQEGYQTFNMQMFWLLDQNGRPVHSIQMNQSPYTTGVEYIGDALLGTYAVNSSSSDMSQLVSGQGSVYFGAYNSNGFYTGTTVTSNVLSTSPIYGDWIQVSLPSARVVSNIAFSSYDYTASPSNVWIVASNDLVTWTQSNNYLFRNGFGSNVTFTINNTISGSFRHWRMIVSNVVPFYYTGPQAGFNLNAFTLTSYQNQRLVSYLNGSGNGNRTVYSPTFYGGTYTGSSVIGTQYGEWIEVSYPTAQISNVIVMDDGYPSQIYVFAGYSPTGTFTKIAGPINVFNLNRNIIYLQFTNTTAYLVYRVLFSATVGNLNTNQVALNMFLLGNNKGESMMPTYTSQSFTSAYPTVYGTGMLGQYNFSSLKQLSGLTEDAYSAFNAQLASWVSQRNYRSDTGAPLSRADYVIIEFPNPIQPTELVLTRPQFNQFQVDGSNDGFGTSNVSILGVTTINPAIDGQPQIFSYALGGSACKSFRILFNTSLYGSNVVSIDDIGFYDNQGRINEPCTSINQFVTTSQNFGGNAVSGNDFIAVTFPSSSNVASYSINSPYFPRSWVVYGNSTASLAGATQLHSVSDYLANSPPNTFQITNPQTFTCYLFKFTAVQTNQYYSNVVINRLNLYTSNGFQLLPTSFTAPSYTAPPPTNQSSECLGTYSANTSIYSSQSSNPFGSSPLTMNTFYNSGSVPASYSPGWSVSAWNYQTDLDGASGGFASLKTTYNGIPQMSTSNILHVNDMFKTRLNPYLSVGTLVLETYFNFTATGTWTFNIGPSGAIGSGNWARMWIDADAKSSTWYNSTATITIDPYSSKNTYVAASTGLKLMRLVVTGNPNLLAFQVISPSGSISNQLGPHVTSGTAGEWIEVKMPAASSIDYYLFSSNVSAWTVYGSNNYQTWISLDSNTANTSNIYGTGNKLPVQIVRIVATGATGPITFNSIKLYSQNGRVNSNYGQGDMLNNTFYGGVYSSLLPYTSPSVGEYAEVFLPYPVAVSGYYIVTNAINWQIHGSTNYSTWTLLDSQKNQYSPKSYYTISTTSNIFRITSNYVSDTLTSSLYVFSFGVTNQNGQPFVPYLTTNVNSFYNSSYYGYLIGTFITTASYSSNSFQSTIGGWTSVGGYYSNGSNTGTVSTVVSAATIYGEWVQEYYQVGIIPTNYYIVGNATWVLAGSTNGSTWTSLATGYTTTSSKGTISTSSINYVRLIVTNNYGTGVKVTLTDSGSNVISYSSGTTGGYFSPTNIITSGTAVGEWLQIQYQGAVSINSMYFTQASNCGYTLLGSQDGSTWTTLYSANPTVTPYG